MWGRRFRHLLIFALAGLFITGCAGPKVYVSKDFASPLRVAVLPMSNQTTDLDGPPFIRQLIFNKLAERGYTVVPLAEIDAKLQSQGFTEGGQLGAAKPQDLGQWLGVDGLFYGTVVDFNYINLGYYWQRKVTVMGRLVSVPSGEKFWEAEKTWMNLNVVTRQQEAERQFAAQLGAKALEKTLHVPLQAESRIAVERLLDTLPRR